MKSSTNTNILHQVCLAIATDYFLNIENLTSGSQIKAISEFARELTELSLISLDTDNLDNDRDERILFQTCLKAAFKSLNQTGYKKDSNLLHTEQIVLFAESLTRISIATLDLIHKACQTTPN